MKMDKKLHGLLTRRRGELKAEGLAIVDKVEAEGRTHLSDQEDKKVSDIQAQIADIDKTLMTMDAQTAPPAMSPPPAPVAHQAPVPKGAIASWDDIAGELRSRYGVR